MTLVSLLETVEEATREVFKELGSGHTETVYEAAMEVELGLKGVSSIRRQVPCPISYKGFIIGTGFIDILLDNILLVEVKAIAKLSHKEETQVRKYLYGTGLEVALLINLGAYVEIIKLTEHPGGLIKTDLRSIQFNTEEEPLDQATN